MIEVYLDSCCKSWGFVELKIKIYFPDFFKEKALNEILRAVFCTDLRVTVQPYANLFVQN
jgi:hypothetical protein